MVKEKKRSAEHKPAKKLSAKRSFLDTDNKRSAFLIGFLSVLVLHDFITHVTAFEFSHAYTADGPLYWTVGRAMLKGMRPYIDMYENKPVGVFALCALSFALTDDITLCSCISVLSILVISLTPLFAVLAYYRNNGGKDKPYDIHVICSSALALLGGVILASYCEDRSGGYQIEAIGTAFSLLFIMAARAVKNAKTKKQQIVRTAFAAVFISAAVMMKEPFLLVAAAGAMLFMESFKDLLKCIVIPCAAGGAATVTALAASGMLKPYLTIYIRQMFSTRLSGGSSAFTRIRDIDLLSGDLIDFDRGLFAAVLFFIVLCLWAVTKRETTDTVYHVCRIVCAVFIASFCVGMGGQYFNHHFIFAAPVYGAFLIYGSEQMYRLQKNGKIADFAAISCFAAILMIAVSNSGRGYGGDYTERYELLKEKAQYVDDMLDFHGVDRYQYLGFNGEDVFVGLTEHLPQGPVFVQDPDNFPTKDTWFSKQLIEQLNNVDIVIVNEVNAGTISDDVQNILNTQFYPLPESGSYRGEKPKDFDYKIYYRHGM